MSNVSALFLAFLITFLPFYNTSIIDLSKYSWTLSQESLNLKVSNLKIHQKENFTNVFLNTKGIDTVSNIVWNNQIIGKKNTYKTWENNLEIQFESPIKYSQRMSDKYYSKYGYKVLPECTPHEYRGECHVKFYSKDAILIRMGLGSSLSFNGYLEAIVFDIIKRLHKYQFHQMENEFEKKYVES
ncbi:E3.2.1.25 [Lepeophtheirus salmonis]|uniref:E3.2.1.25 n=1 Tax=Lepeophtheirus salmonis TaxID=72036 RepID=A0A7R8GYZ0_LEPSM|nr:E3.2.1.25 [Lepeophtheirus salmonis]CAF2754607.1 E3.2.1.25 [Lepeophtheirus salmonis]